MSVTLNKSELTLDQLKYIRICCTFFHDPICKEKDQLKKVLVSLKDIPDTAIKFALDNLFGDLDPILVRYLGRKLRDTSKYGNSVIRPPIELFESYEDKVKVPIVIGSLLTGKQQNFIKEFQSRPFKFTGTLREHQSEIMPKFQYHLNAMGTTTVGLYPGFGKTIIGAYLAASKGLLTCIFIHMSIQINQWKNTFQKNTTAKVWVVGDSNYTDDVNVIICMDERLVHIPSSVKDQIGTVIIDEAHAFCVPSRVPCWQLEPRYLILETATLKRPDDAMERMAYACAGTWGVFIKSSKKFTVVPVRTGIKPERKINKQGGTDWHVMVKSLFTSENRNNQILDIIRLEKDKKILVLTSQVEHVHHIEQLSTDKGYKCSTFCGSASTYKDTSLLIGTLSKIGTAFDEESFSSAFDGRRLEVAILSITIKKPTSLEQSIGRVMRSESPKTYVLIDDDSIIEGHWSLMKWWFREFTNATIEPDIRLYAGNVAPTNSASAKLPLKILSRKQ